MKRASFALLAVTLAFVFACQPAQNVNVNTNANANASSTVDQTIVPTRSPTDKVVQIVIFDAGGGNYEVQDPGSVHLSKGRNQKIEWCIDYAGSASPTNVVIDNFRSPPPPAAPTATNPFGDGTPADNRFDVSKADFNCAKKTKTPRANATLGSYKYTITVFFNGAPKGNRDPEVIIDN